MYLFFDVHLLSQNVAPDATTYNLMFKLYGENSDSNAINALFDEVKAAGLKVRRGVGLECFCSFKISPVAFLFHATM
jgi:pentatricopeptide repeat protein